MGAAVLRRPFALRESPPQSGFMASASILPTVILLVDFGASDHLARVNR